MLEKTCFYVTILSLATTHRAETLLAAGSSRTPMPPLRSAHLWQCEPSVAHSVALR